MRSHEAVRDLIRSWGHEHKPWYQDNSREPLRDEIFRRWHDHPPQVERVYVGRSPADHLLQLLACASSHLTHPVRKIAERHCARIVDAERVNDVEKCSVTQRVLHR